MASRLICVLAVIATPLCAQDWPALRGDGSGNGKPSQLLSSGADVGLKVRWRKTIGSGYSSAVVADGRVVTMYVDSDNDVVAAHDAKTGDVVWKVPVGPMFKGANGSFDGPLSTPTIYKGIVFAFSPRGRLVCVDLKSGDVTWQRELAKDEGSSLPLYGFTTSPIVAADTLIVQLGAKDKMLVGLDLASGRTKWAVGNDRVSSQTPMEFRVAGRSIVLASADKFLTGIDPATGAKLFETEHGGGNGSAVTPVDVGNGRVLLTVDDSFSTAFDVAVDGDKVTAKKAWQERSIKNTYNIPVFHGDSAYGFSTRFLTCVDPKTGKPRWKNRKPGDGFMIGVGDYLLITTKKGSLHVARMSPSQYEEVASLKLFKDLNWSLPAYADNAVFTRSFSELACVDIVSSGDTATGTEIAALPAGPKFAAFLKSVESLDSAAEKTTLVNKFMEGQNTFPVTEGNVVHFVYRGECRDVAVACDVFGSRQERRMQNVAATDLYYYSMTLPEDQVANYVFLVDYQVQPDKLNSRRTTSSMYAGEMEFAIRLRNEKPLSMSWFAMPEWNQPKFLATADVADRKLVGKLVSQEIDTDKKGAKIPVDVYLPPQYESDTNKRFPVVYVVDGAAASKQLVGIADTLFKGDTRHPAILVFLKAQFDPMRPGADRPAETAKFVVPFVDKTYRTRTSSNGRSVYGTGFASSDAFRLAGSQPSIFGSLYVQSPLIFDAGQAELVSMFRKIDKPQRVCVEWGRYDMHNPHENWDIRKIGKSMADQFAENKTLQVTSRQFNDSTDWRAWRSRFDKVLEFLVRTE